MKEIGENSGFVESELVAVSHEQDSFPQIAIIHSKKDVPFRLRTSHFRTINVKKDLSLDIVFLLFQRRIFLFKLRTSSLDTINVRNW